MLSEGFKSTIKEGFKLVGLTILKIIGLTLIMAAPSYGDSDKYWFIYFGIGFLIVDLTGSYFKKWWRFAGRSSQAIQIAKVKK